MDARRRSGVRGGLFEKPCEGRAEKGEQRRPAEDIDISQECGLAQQEAVHESHGPGARLHGANMVAEISCDGARSLL